MLFAATDARLREAAAGPSVVALVPIAEVLPQAVSRRLGNPTVVYSFRDVFVTLKHVQDFRRWRSTTVERLWPGRGR